MELTVKKRRANELATFFKCKPSDVATPKDFMKIQRFRVAIERSIQSYQDRFREYFNKFEQEKKPFVEQIQNFIPPECPEGEDSKKWEKQKKEEKATELNDLFSEVIKPYKDEIDAYDKEEGDKEVLVTVNEEDMQAAKTFFEAKSSEYWLNTEAYMQVCDFMKV